MFMSFTACGSGDSEEKKQNDSSSTKLEFTAETLSAGEYNTIAVRNDGTVVAVGHNEHGECDVSEWTDIVAVSAGSGHTVGLKSDGTVVAVGSGEECLVGYKK